MFFFLNLGIVPFRWIFGDCEDDVFSLFSIAVIDFHGSILTAGRVKNRSLSCLQFWVLKYVRICSMWLVMLKKKNRCML